MSTAPDRPVADAAIRYITTAAEPRDQHALIHVLMHIGYLLEHDAADLATEVFQAWVTATQEYDERTGDDAA